MEFRIGDKVRVIEDEHHYLKAGEVGIVTDIGSYGCIKIQLLNPTYGKGLFYIEQSNLELLDSPSVIIEDIKSPIRYTTGNIEVWDYIIDQNMNFLEGNIIKYLSRYKNKGGVKDLEKAKVYLEKLIKVTK